MIMRLLHEPGGHTRGEKDRIALRRSILSKHGLRIIFDQKRYAEPDITDLMLGAVEGRDQRVVMARNRFTGEKVCVGDKLRKTRPVFSDVPAFAANGHFHGTAAYNLSVEPVIDAPRSVFGTFGVYHHGQILDGHRRSQDDLIGREYSIAVEIQSHLMKYGRVDLADHGLHRAGIYNKGPFRLLNMQSVERHIDGFFELQEVLLILFQVGMQKSPAYGTVFSVPRCSNFTGTTSPVAVTRLS